MSTVMRIHILFTVEELPRSRYMFGSAYISDVLHTAA
jgi:hypothetical protein